MKKIVVLLLTLVFVVFNITTTFAEEKKAECECKKIILIDPGHGGRDGGAVSKKKTIEKDINLIIGKKLKELLNQKYTVSMTREDDISLHEEGTKKSKKHRDLVNRRKMIDDIKCDLFISIHLNKFNNENARGVQAYYANNDNSKIFAEFLTRNFSEATGGKGRTPKVNDNFIVLKDIDSIPAVIFECGFLSNNEDDELLNKDEYQTTLAKIMEKSIDEYFGINNPQQ